MKVGVKGKKILIRNVGDMATAAGVIREQEMDTEDKAIQDALKRLGWMSPEDVALVRQGFSIAYAFLQRRGRPLFSVRKAAEKFDEYDIIRACNKSEEFHRNSDAVDAFCYATRYFRAGLSNRGKSRYSNMSLAELLTEAEACVRNGITSPLYDEVLDRLRQVAETLECINEPR